MTWEPPAPTSPAADPGAGPPGAGEAGLSRARRNLLRGLVALFLVCLGGVATWSAATAVRGSEAISPLPFRITWSMPDRYGLDEDGNGIIDYDTTSQYLNPSSWKAVFDVCDTPLYKSLPADQQSVRWTFSDAGGFFLQDFGCHVEPSFPKLGRYDVAVENKNRATLEVIGQDSTQAVLKDVLIVSVGDSIGSGEGNPDKLKFGVFPGLQPQWEDQQCHRSALAGSAQAALRLERRDPKSSVTFLHLACSGAKIDVGLLGPYEGIEPKLGPPKPPQLDEMATLVGNRQVDGLFVSIGANNIGFSKIVELCIEFHDCPNFQNASVKNARQVFEENIGLLPAAYAQLDAKVDSMKVTVGGQQKPLVKQVFMTQYFDPATQDDGQYCDGLTAREREANVYPDGHVVDGVSQDEWQWASETVVATLNQAVVNGAVASSGGPSGAPTWTAVTGIPQEFRGHGYCAVDRWTRTLFESFGYQQNKDGAFHPNAEGHLLGIAKHLEAAAAPALGIQGTPVPFTADPVAVGITKGLATLTSATDRMKSFVNAYDAFTQKWFVGTRDEMNANWQALFQYLAQAQAVFEEWSNDPKLFLTKLDNQLDDLDGDGDPTVDFRAGNLTVDVEGRILPHLKSDMYYVRFDSTATFKVPTEVDYVADKLHLKGSIPTAFVLEQHLDIFFDNTQPTLAKKFRLLPSSDFGTVRAVMDAQSQAGAPGPEVAAAAAAAAEAGPDVVAPLDVAVGILDTEAVGTVKATTAMVTKLKDPNGDGIVDMDELATGGNAIFDPQCASGSITMDLTVTADLQGLQGQQGDIDVNDPQICNGVETPDVALGPLDVFRSITATDLVNGLAQVSTALGGIQQAADLDIPFVKEGASTAAEVNERLVKFFVDNQLTDPADPMKNITFDAATRPDLDTAQEVVLKLALALGLPDLGLRFEGTQLKWNVDLSVDPAPITGAGTLDFGDQLSRVGPVGLEGTAKATIDPAYRLKLGMGVDLAAGLSLENRFFLQNGPDPELTVDAAVSADLDLTGRVSILGLRLRDGNAAGPVTLLQRKDAAKPMLAVQLGGGANNDDKLTLGELAQAVANAQSPVTFTLNAAVPSTVLSATLDIAGQPLAAGSITIAWPDLANPSSLAINADAAFVNAGLPFAFDPDDPAASVGQLLTATRETLTRLRAYIAENPNTVRDLPLVGKSAAELDPVLARLQGTVDDLVQIANTLSLQQARDAVAHAIAQALGLPQSAEATIFQLSYQPATASQRAAIVATLTLGVCTADRTGPQCTTTNPKLQLPININLGSTGVLGVSGSGNVEAGYEAKLALTFGVELPTVTPNPSGGLPVVSGAPRLFVLDTSKVELAFGTNVSTNLQAGLGPVTVGLGGPGKPLTAKLGVRFKLGTASPTSTRKYIGESSFDSWLTTLLPANVHDTVVPSGCPLTSGQPTDGCATLPVFLSSTYLGDITFAAPDLLNPSGWTADATQVLNALSSEQIQYGLIVDGLGVIAERLESALRNVKPGTTIPLLGTNVTAAADVVHDFRTGVLTPAQTLVNDLTSVTSGSSALDLVGKTQDWFVAKIGPSSSVKILKDVNGNGNYKDDIRVLLDCKKSNGTTSACVAADPASSVQRWEVVVPMGGQIGGTLPPFDIGFPGLRLASTGRLSGAVGWDLTLGFGIDKTKGFYLATGQATPELAVTATAGLPDAGGTTPDLTGDLAFIPLSIYDRHDGNDVEVKAGIDLVGGTGGRLGLSELGSLDLQPALSVCSNVSLEIQTTADPTAQSAFPKLVSTLNMKGGYTCNGSLGAPAGTSWDIGFDNVSVDIGTFMSKFITPVAQRVREATKPLEPVVDAIRQPIPGVADAARIAGLPEPRWYDLFKAVDNLNGGNNMQVIDRVIQVIDLARVLGQPANSGGNGSIPIGSFKVVTAAASAPVSTDGLDKLIGAKNVPDDSSLLGRLGGNISSAAKQQLDSARSQGGFSFPAWDKPSSLFGLLLGKDVDLVKFDAGKLEIKRSFSFAFPIGPITLFIGGSAGVQGHFAMGFDTYGFRLAYQTLSDDDPTNDGFFDVVKGLVQGIYIDDFDKNGKDIPEIVFTGELTAGAGLGAPGLSIRVEGGIDAVANVDLRDPTPDGKVRFEDFESLLRKNSNPICLFQISAKVGAFLRLVGELGPFSKDFPIADVVIYEQGDVTSFCLSPGGEPVTAKRYSDGTLALKAQPITDKFVMVQTTKGTVRINAFGVTEEFKNVKRVFGNLQGGDDQVSLTSDVPDALPALFCGGAGRDRFEVTSGPASLYGDDGPGTTVTNSGSPLELPCAPAGTGGDDTLTSGDGADTLDGGPGNDTLVAAGGDDTLGGGDGNDTMRGGVGSDALDGGNGDDTTDYAGHPGAVAVALPGPSGQIGTPEADTAAGTERIVGTVGNDTLTAGAATAILDGLDGNDVLQGGPADDLVLAGNGDDALNGGGGRNLLYGGNGNDTYTPSTGSDTFYGEVGTDTADYSAQTEPVWVQEDDLANDGVAGNRTSDIRDTERLLGGSADDLLVGGVSNDVIQGNGGNDALSGGGGADSVVGGQGDDTLSGGSGPDVLSGGSGNDTADYSARTDALVISVDGVANDGSPADGLPGNGAADDVQTDIERVVGGSSNDRITGRNAPDTLEGGPGDDALLGLNGANTLLGQDGNDTLVGGSGVDTAQGGPGDDTLSGVDGDDVLDGQDGNDTALGGPGTDQVAGGPGNDTLRGGRGGDTISGGEGSDTIHGDEIAVVQDGNTDTIDAGPGDDAVYGGPAGDVIDGGDGNDTLAGEDGVDTLRGGNGDDRLTGGVGADDLDGGTGDDIVAGDDDADLVQGGDGADQLLGGQGPDTLSGGAGDDRLSGLNGDDVMDGGTGADVLIGGNGEDTATWAGRTEAVTVAIDATANDGSAADALTGSAAGSPGADDVDVTVERVVGGDGDDTLTSSAAGSHTLDGGEGNDTLTVQWLLTDPQSLLGGDGNDTLTGGNGPDTLDGGNGDDTVDGAGGDDRIVEGPAANGADVLGGGDGFDTVDYLGRTNVVATSNDGAANDGEAGEGDNIGGDVESFAVANPAPGIVAADAAAAEGSTAGGETVVKVTVTLPAAVSTDTFVRFRTVDGTATATTGDYVAVTNGKVKVAAGKAKAIVKVKVRQDADVEADETFVVQLVAPDGYSLVKGTATVTITNDDGPGAGAPAADAVVDGADATGNGDGDGGDATTAGAASGDPSATPAVTGEPGAGEAVGPGDAGVARHPRRRPRG